MKKSTLFGLTAGLALLSAPVAAFADGDVNTDEKVITPVFNPQPYNFTEDYEGNIVLKEGQYIENLQGITAYFFDLPVLFEENVNDVFGNPICPVILTNTYTGDVYYCWDPQQIVRTEFELNGGTAYNFVFFPEAEDGEDPVYGPINMPGLYELTLNNMYIYGDGYPENTNTIVVAPVTVPYYIAPAYRLIPEPEFIFPEGIGFFRNGNNSELWTIEIEFFNSNVTPVDNLYGRHYATLTNVYTGETYYCNYPDRNTSAETDGVVYTFIFVNEDGEQVNITDAGEYTLSVYGFGYEDENGDIIEIQVADATYYIRTPFTYVLWPTPGVVSVIPYVQLTFPLNDDLYFYEPPVYSEAYLTKYEIDPVTNEMIELYTYTCVSSREVENYQGTGNSFYLYFENEEGTLVNAIQEEGNYVLRIGYIIGDEGYVNSTFNYPILEYYTIDFSASNNEDETNPDFSTGVDAIDGVASYNVYNMTGVKVLNNGSAADVNNLAKGMYIINGKKVVVK